MNPRKVLIIGGTGHIGCYLVPRLVQSGFEVHVLARHARPQYTDPRLGWPSVQWIIADRGPEEKSGAWADRMRAIDASVVVDLICFHPEQQQVMYEAFRGRIDHFLHCGTIWSYGAAEHIPYEESHPRRPLSDYGKNKAAIEAFLFEKFKREGFPATVIHPGHISGRKWRPVDPHGAWENLDIYNRLATGQEVVLPDVNAILHHVHADDVAQLFELAIQQRERALGEAFSAVAALAMSPAGCCRAIARMFGREPNLRFVLLNELDRHLSKASAQCMRDIVIHTTACSIAKGQRLLGYQPRYTTEQIYAECLDYLLESGQLKV